MKIKCWRQAGKSNDDEKNSDRLEEDENEWKKVITDGDD